MKCYGKKGRERQIKKVIVDEIEWFCEHCDLLTLVALHEEFGFGAERLRKLYRRSGALHDEFKRKYMAADDTVTERGRCDTYAMKEYLKRIGFDFDKECEILLAEIDAEENK